MTTIEVKHLSFGYEGQPTKVFEDVSFQLDSNWKLGIVGRNGRGKTTLLRILAGHLLATGKVYCPLDVGYFPQTIENREQTVYEWLHATTEAEFWQMEIEAGLIGLDSAVFRRPIAQISGGEETKVQLMALFLAQKEFMLLDEPTNHLDQTTRSEIARYLKKQRTGLLVVSHDRLFLDTFVDHVLSIDKAKIEIRQGTVATYLTDKKRQDAFEEVQADKIAKEVKKLTAIAHDKRNWAHSREQDLLGNPKVKGSGSSGLKGPDSARAARMMKKALTVERRREKKLAETKNLLKNREYTESLTVGYTPSREVELVRLSKLQLAYESNQWLFQPVSETLERGERIALVGPNGSGKTSLIEALQGQFTGQIAGEIRKKGQLSIAYVRQRYEVPTQTLMEVAENDHLSVQNLYHLCKQLGLERDVFSRKISEMSLGQQKKVEVARAFATPAELLIWDEPLNYLDFANHEQILEVVQTLQPTLLFVEHDHYFREQVATKVITLDAMA